MMTCSLQVLATFKNLIIVLWTYSPILNSSCVLFYGAFDPNAATSLRENHYYFFLIVLCSLKLYIFLLLGCEIELANRGAFRIFQLDFG